MPSQKWSVNADGGFLANPVLSKKLRYVTQPLMKFRNFSRPEPGYGKRKGDRILFDRISNVLDSGGRISELQKMPETKVNIGQGVVIVDEYGNSIPWTGKLEDLAEFDVENIWLRTLRDDAAKTLDREVANEFRTCKVKVTPAGTNGATTVFDEDGTVSTAATGHASAATIKDIADEMKSKYLVPFYDGENYIAIVSVKLGRALKDDNDFENAALYGDPDRLFSGEIGRYYGIRFIEETHVLANKLGTSNFFGEGIFFGADPVVEGIAVPLEMRAKIPGDYGRDKGLAWYFMGGWEITWDTANPGEAKIVHLTAV